MKKNKLNELLKKMSTHSTFEEGKKHGIINLNDELSQTIYGGGHATTKNGMCSGTNGVCANDLCSGTTNTSCSNGTCVVD